VGERSPGQIGVVFRDERQNALARHELAGNRVSYGGHPVGEADALVPGLQTLGGVVDDDIVQVVASVIEGANVVTDLELKASDVRCLQVHGAPPAGRLPPVYARRWSRRTNRHPQVGPSWSKVAND